MYRGFWLWEAQFDVFYEGLRLWDVHFVVFYEVIHIPIDIPI